MAEIFNLNDCSARVAYSHGLSKRALINPAVSLFRLRGITLISPENGDMNNKTTALSTALPAGYRNNDGNFNNMSNNAIFWSSSEYSTNNAWNRNLNYNNTEVNRNNNNKENGFSVCCVRDLLQSLIAWRSFYRPPC